MASNAEISARGASSPGPAPRATEQVPGDHLILRGHMPSGASCIDRSVAEELSYGLRRQEFAVMSARSQAREAFEQELALAIPAAKTVCFRTLTEFTASTFKTSEEYVAGVAKPWNSMLTLGDPGSNFHVPLASHSQLSAPRGCPMLVRGTWDARSGHFLVNAAQMSQAWRWGPRFPASITGAQPEALSLETSCSYRLDRHSEIAVLARLSYPFRNTSPIITLDDIKWVHSELVAMESDLRSIPVVVRLYGRPVSHLPPPAHVPTLLSQLLNWLEHQHASVHPVRLAAEFVARFVRIHPFDDGNGRCGRVLGAWLLKGAGYHPAGLITVRDYLYQALHEHYYAIAQYQRRPLIWHQLYFDAVSMCMRLGTAQQ